MVLECVDVCEMFLVCRDLHNPNNGALYLVLPFSCKHQMGWFILDLVLACVKYFLDLNAFELVNMFY